MLVQMCVVSTMLRAKQSVIKSLDLIAYRRLVWRPIMTTIKKKITLKQILFPKKLKNFFFCLSLINLFNFFFCSGIDF